MNVIQQEVPGVIIPVASVENCSRQSMGVPGQSTETDKTKKDELDSMRIGEAHSGCAKWFQQK